MARPRFDPNRDYVAARSFTYLGVDYAAGDPFDKSGIAPHRLNTLYGSRAVNMAEGDAAPKDGIVLRQTRPGYFEINAPWFDEPEKVRGKQNAEKRLAEVREAGEPFDWGGVTIEGGEGGWYTVSAEWEDEPRKVQGEDAAKAEAARLRAEGPYPDGAERVEIAQDETTEKFLVSAPWLPGVEEYATVEEAKARQSLIRREGPPEGFDFEKAEAERIEREKADAENAAKAAAEAEETNRKVRYSDAVSLSETTVDGATTYTVTAPDGEPETFDDKAKAEARVAELREAGPPEGWTVPAE